MTAISMLSSEKNMPKEVVIEAIEAALVSAYRRNFPSAPQSVAAVIDPETGAPRVFLERKVVPELGEDPDEITIEEARAIDPNIRVGEVLRTDVTPPQFGRIAAQTAKQVVLQKLREAERRRVFDQFTERQGEIVHGLVQRIEQGTAIIELDKTEAVMPRSEQIPTERHYPGQRLRVVIVDVHDSHKGPQVLVSRAHRLMLRRLLEQEVPEIFSGTVEIKAIAREAGARAKVAVAARQEGIDPVGSCVGMRGVRIQNVVNELSGEKIDVVQWDPDPAVFVANALSPAQVVSVAISEEENTARVIVPERQLSLAIGKEGQNARLAAKLTGWRIDIRSDAASAAAAAEGRAEAQPVAAAAAGADGRAAGEATPGAAGQPAGGETVAAGATSASGEGPGTAG
ncbi:MAG TPA: transcription termination factor NusA [Chloroflexota bacterium]|nr:transcription termination factor NusA [Chloroflexota bacterium]